MIAKWLSAALSDPNVCQEMKADIEAWFAENELLPDGREKLKQENSLLRSQLANCHKEISNLRDEILRYGGGTA